MFKNVSKITLPRSTESKIQTTTSLPKQNNLVNLTDPCYLTWKASNSYSGSFVLRTPCPDGKGSKKFYLLFYLKKVSGMKSYKLGATKIVFCLFALFIFIPFVRSLTFYFTWKWFSITTKSALTRNYTRTVRNDLLFTRYTVKYY